ncbi:MAG: PEP_CTERM-anchored TLD domain-containing protein [Planctomyces sp.]|nr:PEP_CTERM-anchored TLD domain-containing protein [Planctomyces sp.]
MSFRTGWLLGAMVMCCLPKVGEGAMISGGSNILSQSDADQLETWLGQGPITQTNIFSFESGPVGQNIAFDFHAAADGKGPTFTVVRVDSVWERDTITGEWIDRPDLTGQIVGGYNPESWVSFVVFNFSWDPTVREAFLFNLSTSLKLDQRSDDQGVFQTYNAIYNGPVFGGGFDLYIDNYQDDQPIRNYAYDYSYGELTGQNVFGMQWSYFSLSHLEVFTIAPYVTDPTDPTDPGAANPVPEPGSLALLGLGGLGLFHRLRRRTSTANSSADA